MHSKLISAAIAATPCARCRCCRIAAAHCGGAGLLLVIAWVVRPAASCMLVKGASSTIEPAAIHIVINQLVSKWHFSSCHCTIAACLCITAACPHGSLNASFGALPAMLCMLVPILLWLRRLLVVVLLLLSLVTHVGFHVRMQKLAMCISTPIMRRLRLRCMPPAILIHVALM